MRVLNSAAGNEDGHGHSHSHSHAVDTKSTGTSTAIKPSEGELRSRKSPSDVTTITPTAPEAVPNPSLRLSAYLNLFGDFTHNITDGLAMAASFYSSPVLGAVTTIATFCHEIPHEVSRSPNFAKFRLPTTQSSSNRDSRNDKQWEVNSLLLSVPSLGRS
jgi:zinc transporter 7